MMEDASPVGVEKVICMTLSFELLQYQKFVHAVIRAVGGSVGSFYVPSILFRALYFRLKLLFGLLENHQIIIIPCHNQQGFRPSRV